jgi:hypothetical protein
MPIFNDAWAKFFGSTKEFLQLDRAASRRRISITAQNAKRGKNRESSLCVLLRFLRPPKPPSTYAT